MEPQVVNSQLYICSLFPLFGMSSITGFLLTSFLVSHSDVVPPFSAPLAAKGGWSVCASLLASWLQAGLWRVEARDEGRRPCLGFFCSWLPLLLYGVAAGWLSPSTSQMSKVSQSSTRPPLSGPSLVPSGSGVVTVLWLLPPILHSPVWAPYTPPPSSCV